jgi:hypothetical protein
MTTQETTQAVVVPFASVEVQEAFFGNVAGAFKKYEGAARNLVGTLLTSARALGVIVTEADWDEYLAKATRKGIAAKVAPGSVKVYVSQAKRATIAATGRPPITDALPLGAHWCDQRTNKRKLEGVNAYDKRITALLKVATRNELGHLVLPEGYSLLGEQTAALVAEAPKADETTGSAGQSSDQEGGVNVDPADAKADALETAALVLMGNVKAAKALLDLIADAEGKKALATTMAAHAKAKAEAAAKAAADAKAGEALNNANV